MKTLAVLLCAAASLAAQSLTPSLAPSSILAGKTVALTLTYAAGSTASAALQWSISPPAGVTVSGWTLGAAGAAAAKALTCAGTTTQTCVLAGLNTNSIASGVVATATVALAVNDRGAEPEAIVSALGADATAAAIVTSGGTASVTAISPFDLNGDGKIDVQDLSLAIQQLNGSQPCTSADFNGDGKCNVQDLLLLIIDAGSANP